MKRRSRLAVLALAAAAATSLAGLPAAWAQINGVGLGISGPGLVDTPALADGQTIGEVRVDVRGRAEEGQDAADLVAAARRAFGFSPGATFNAFVADAALGRVRAVPGVRNASYRLALSPGAETLGTVLHVTLGSAETRSVTDMLTGGAAAFPVILQNDTTLLRFTLNGGAGVFSDGNPWFAQPLTFTRGNPLVQNPPLGAGTGARATWSEAYSEYGIGGATRLGRGPFYIYGAVSGLTALSTGQDIFRNGTRSRSSVEKLYAGVIYAPADSSLRINTSIGKQNFTLNDGFLISQYGSQWNAGPRPGVYLAPRTTHDMAALLTAKWDRFVFTGFDLDPNEYEPLESNTRVVGGNLRFNATTSFYGDVTAMYVPRSDTLYPVPSGPPLGRQGLTVVAGHLRWADPDVAPGVWLESELAHETNTNFPMSAWAGYGTAGYLARSLPWSPSISYRYAAFSGDNPATRTYERFDTLYSGGLNEWLLGITSAKVLSQSNRTVHRIRLNVEPVKGTTLTLDWYLNRAQQLNNLGANPALAKLGSHDLGQEWQLVLRTPLSAKLYFLGVASVALPGAAIQDATGGAARPWSSLQAQLFWYF